ncbi:MAG: transposase [Bacteroidia bacterium]|nr:transposase [Bacteroidia bacterium]MCZ2356462.1 transposase [Bacteroidia bacterium]MCZ2357382.1 transposase [Bacteroidia bacterium]
MNVENIADLYQQSLMIYQGQVTCTGISLLMEGSLSHDRFTRLLSSGNLNEEYLWKRAKPLCYEIRSKDAVLIIDETIEGKPYTDENELICWHFDHASRRNVKGVAMLTALYHSNEMSVPAGVEFITKPIKTVNAKGKQVRKSRIGKNELFRKMVNHAFWNLDFEYVLSDSWFGNSENMKFIAQKHNGKFIFALKSNRKVALTLDDKQNGRYTSIKSLKPEGRTAVVWVEQLDFPILIACQIFTNENDTAALYLASNDLNLSYEQITAIYHKRWKVEEYHKSIKSNASFAKSPTRTITTQKSHFIASLTAFNRFELLKVRKNKSHFALKNYLNIVALRKAKEELQHLLTPSLKNTT